MEKYCILFDSGVHAFNAPGYGVVLKCYNKVVTEVANKI